MKKLDNLVLIITVKQTKGNATYCFVGQVTNGITNPQPLLNSVNSIKFHGNRDSVKTGKFHTRLRIPRPAENCGPLCTFLTTPAVTFIIVFIFAGKMCVCVCVCVML